MDKFNSNLAHSFSLINKNIIDRISDNAKEKNNHKPPHIHYDGFAAPLLSSSPGVFVSTGFDIVVLYVFLTGSGSYICLCYSGKYLSMYFLST